MILILKLYEKISCSEHNPHPYFFVLKPLFQVKQKNLRNEYSERIITLVQYIASIEIDRIQPFVNLIFAFGKYVGEEFFVKTLHEVFQRLLCKVQQQGLIQTTYIIYSVSFFQKLLHFY